MIFCRAASWLALFLLIHPPSGYAGISQLVEQASTPEVMFGQPAVYDSLLTRIAAGGESSARQLLEHAATPWAWRFEVVRQGLKRIGEPARLVILENLRAGNLSESKTVKNLVLLEKLGRAGDEAFLAVYLESGDGGRKITALRCLAAFGEPKKSLELALPLLADVDENVRLAAVWAVGELWKRCDYSRLQLDLAARLRELKNDPVLQVRLTVAEILEAGGAGQDTGLLKSGGR